MKRHAPRPAHEEDEPVLDVSSLIDICFLLLVFFLVTSTIKAKERDLDIRLGGPPVTSETPPPPFFIAIDASGAVFTGEGSFREPLDGADAPRDLPLLSERLADYATAVGATLHEPSVHLAVDGNARQQRVVDVLNALARRGIAVVAFSDPPEER